MILKNPKLRFNAIFTCTIRKESDSKLGAMTTSPYKKMMSKCKGMKKMEKNTKNKQLKKKMKMQLFLLHVCYFLLSKEDTQYYVFFVAVGNIVSNSENLAKEICSLQQKSHFLFLGVT